MKTVLPKLSRACILLIILMYLAGLVLYPKLPDIIPSHWNIEGKVDGYTAKNAFLLFLPTLTLGIYIFMSFAPILDPKPESYRQFKGIFELFRFIMVLFFFVLYFVSLLVALGIPINVSKIVQLLVGGLLIFIGNYFGKIRHNYTFGIKTPWTLANEEVWNKTHRLSGPLWVVTGVLWVSGVFFPGRVAFIIGMGSLLLVSVVGAIYSYILFKKLSKE